MISVVTNLGAKADLNVVDDLGVYQAVDCVNGPTGVTGYVFLHVTSANVGGNSRAVQKLWNLSSGTEYTRVKTIGGWTPWETAGTGGGGGDYDPLGTADAVMADHLAQADPHPQYHNDARGDARYDALGAASSAVSTHVAAVDPHTQYLTNARGDARYDVLNAASDAVTAHVGAVDPHTQYLTNARGDARYDTVGTADAAVTAHEAAADPHTQYHTDARGDARYDALGTGASEAASAVSTHVAAVDPHTQYLTNARADARYDAIGTADAAIVTHEAETDPHTQYAKKAGDTFSGDIMRDGPAGTARTIWFTTGGIARFSLMANAVAESGGNAGSNFNLTVFDDTGSALYSAFTIQRTGGILFAGSGAFTFNGNTILHGGNDTDYLKTNRAATLSVGINSTNYAIGTVSSGTLTPANANGGLQKCTNGGAFSLAPPTTNCTLILDITNSATAGAITTSAFSKVTGDAFNTTNGQRFRCYITSFDTWSHLYVLQMN